MLILQWFIPAAPVTLRWLVDGNAANSAGGAALAVDALPVVFAGSGERVTAPAAVAIGALKAVRIGSDGLARLADAASAHGAIGVATNAAAVGEDLTIQIGGPIDDASWSWAEGPVWLGLAGALTQVVPVAGALVQIGVSAGATRLIVAPSFVAMLN